MKNYFGVINTRGYLCYLTDCRTEAEKVMNESISAFDYSVYSMHITRGIKNIAKETHRKEADIKTSFGY